MTSPEFPDQNEVEARSLEEVRGAIDAVDLEIASLIEKRLGLVSVAQQIKQDQGLSIIDVPRELKVLSNVREYASSEHTMRIFRTIIDECRVEQGALTPGEMRDVRPPQSKDRGWHRGRGW